MYSEPSWMIWNQFQVFDRDYLSHNIIRYGIKSRIARADNVVRVQFSTHARVCLPGGTSRCKNQLT